MSSTIAFPHIIESQQFERPWLEAFFTRTDQFAAAWSSNGGKHLLRRLCHELLACTFFGEESTRTRISFETAAIRLGMDVVSTTNAKFSSSMAKGESWDDTARVLGGYEPNVIIVRMKETGAAERASRLIKTPVINAGDGTGQHPTQSLIDYYTIWKEMGRIDGLNVLIGGDLKHGRTVHSLAYLLGKARRIHINFVSPPELPIPTEIKAYLTRHRVTYGESDKPFPALAEADVIYWTRIQRERMNDETYEAVKNRFVIGLEEMSHAKKDAILMHPLPKVGEIAPEVDGDPRAIYFKQAANGLPLRMALLSWVVGRNL